MAMTGKSITATGHLLSNAASVWVVGWSGDGTGQARAVFYDSLTAAGATSGVERFRFEAGPGTGATGTTRTATFPADTPLNFNSAVYITLTNIRHVSVGYQDRKR